jgi:hypothetical protein
MAYRDENKTPHIIVCDNFLDLNAYIRSAFMLNGYEAHHALSASEYIDKLKELNDVVDAQTVVIKTDSSPR